jgi:ribosomal protein L37E
MARICPNCGRPAIDEQSQFCNKCGSPFPEDQPKKVVVRTTPRLADTPPPPPAMEPLVAEPRAPVAPPTRSYADPPRVRPPVKQPAQKTPARGSPLPFKKLIGRDFIKPVYWLGVIAILLLVFAGITADLPKTDAATEPVTDTDTGSGFSDILSGIPLFWIGVFIIGNLLWRVLCEMSTVLFALRDSGISVDNSGAPGPEPLYEDEMPAYGEGGMGEMVACPRCGKIVPAEELETCDECGVQGCSSCVRKMGLLKSRWICRDCFKKK